MRFTYYRGMRRHPVEKCEPAATIIAMLGGLAEVAKAADVSLVTAQRWTYPFQHGGTGGHIPRKYHDRLIELAREKGDELPIAAFVDASFVPRTASSPSEAA